MSNARAEIRSNWTRMLVEAYQRSLPPAVFAEAMARVPAARRTLLDASGPFDWLPAEVHLAVAEAPLGLMTPEAFREVWKHHLLESFERPIFRSLIQGALRLFTRTPLALMKVAPHGWSLVSRNAGEFVIEGDAESSNHGRVRIVDLPQSYRGSEAWALAWAGTLDAFIELAGVEGEVTIDRSGAARGQITYDVRWKARAASASA